MTKFVPMIVTATEVRQKRVLVAVPDDAINPVKHACDILGRIAEVHPENIEDGNVVSYNLTFTSPDDTTAQDIIDEEDLL